MKPRRTRAPAEIRSSNEIPAPVPSLANGFAAEISKDIARTPTCLIRPRFRGQSPPGRTSNPS